MTTYTSNFNLEKIDYNTRGWHEKEYANLDIIDGVLEALQEATGVNQYYAVATGAASAYAVTYSPAVSAYVVGLVIQFKANHTNTGATTVDVNGLGAKTIQRNGSALTASSITSGAYVKAIYDGTQFQLIEPQDTSVTIADGSIGHAKLSTGHPTWDTSGNLAAAGKAAVSGNVTGNKLYEGVDGGTVRRVLTHLNPGVDSGRITFSTATPSGGAAGDIWFRYA